ncbi:MAG: Na+-dependent transporter [Methanomassiliicoccaceae archaeon]|nr:Na+-dependent transporter [Methanomassiliicoccaceae archaeon]
MPITDMLKDVRIWIVSALVFGLIIGDTGNAPIIAVITLMVLMCVSLHGLTFNRSDIIENKKIILLGIFICYGVAGTVTLLVGSFYSHELWLGWVILAAVPCAISVITGTLILKGNTKSAMIVVTAVYLAALVITPLITHVFIGEAVSPLEVLKYVTLFILVPFLISIPLRNVALNADAKAISINIMFFILIFVTFGANKEFILGEPGTVLWVAAGCLVRVAAIAAVMELILKYVRMRRDSRIPMVLMSIWKNSALAMSMTMILIPTTESVMPAALSLPIEMLFFMVMMWYYSKRCAPVQEERMSGKK